MIFILKLTSLQLPHGCESLGLMPRPHPAHARRRILVSQVQILGLAPEAWSDQWNCRALFIGIMQKQEQVLQSHHSKGCHSHWPAGGVWAWDLRIIQACDNRPILLAVKAGCKFLLRVNGFLLAHTILGCVSMKYKFLVKACNWSCHAMWFNPEFEFDLLMCVVTQGAWRDLFFSVCTGTNQNHGTVGAGF